MTLPSASAAAPPRRRAYGCTRSIIHTDSRTPARRGVAGTLQAVSATLVAAGLAASSGDRVLFSDVDLVVAPGDVVGLVGVNGAGKSTLLRILGGLLLPDAGTVILNPPAAVVGYLAQERGARQGESVSDFIGRRTGVRQARARMDAAALVLAAGARRWRGLQRGLRAVARPGRRGSRRPGSRGGRRRRPGRRSRCSDGRTVRRPGGPCRAGGAAAQPLRRGAARRAHERPGPRRAGPAGALRDRPAGRRGAGQPRPGVPRPNRDERARTRPCPARHQARLRWLCGVSGGARDRTPARARELRGVRRPQGVPGAAGAHSAFLDGQGGRQRPPQGDRQRQDRSQVPQRVDREAGREGAPDPAASRAPGGGRRAAQGVAATDGDRAGAAVGGGGGRGERGGRATRRLRPGTGEPAGRPGGPDRHHRPERIGQEHPAGLLLGRLSPDEGTATLGAGVVVGEVDQARSLFDSDATLARAVGEHLPELDDASVRTLLAKFGLRSEHVRRPADTLSPGERTRAALALLQARGVNLLVLDEPTNHLDLPAIEQLESALDCFTGTVLLVTHDRQMLAAVRTSRQLSMAGGVVSEG
ncbi:ATP-binding cassette domain-containing protein [Jatrophihabitans sp. DSM 44399]|uniref:ATP-binding cassette domain-containing protein n=1 Tax=Jatrophihabitans lederbergiae TaxID=3075547 RepID=A0ABU2JCI0_9ACTN|nr:ATP-binding cassette domain-containing protein [Jatrophihabitans sp. DSM 44399]MDT0262698.1 ATP-binding cassette domain-containing protein [Jatrophihabitans sp. DSM 44399]